MPINEFLNKINQFILNPLIIFLFAVATLVFFVGVVQFLATAETDAGREEGKRKLVFGLIGMFVMFSAYGIIHLILGTFGITNSANQHEQYIQF
ncbi:hypothetical protein KW785_00130 [Candidatus Parcubacteria bacterium]|nr:hypothetical protein [Candidatus Parcubacteria bacterium]